MRASHWTSSEWSETLISQYLVHGNFIPEASSIISTLPMDRKNFRRTQKWNSRAHFKIATNHSIFSRACWVCQRREQRRFELFGNSYKKSLKAKYTRLIFAGVSNPHKQRKFEIFQDWCSSVKNELLKWLAQSQNQTYRRIRERMGSRIYFFAHVPLKGGTRDRRRRKREKWGLTSSRIVKSPFVSVGDLVPCWEKNASRKKL